MKSERVYHIRLFSLSFSVYPCYIGSFYQGVLSSNSLYTHISVNNPTLIITTSNSVTNINEDNEYVNYQLRITAEEQAGSYTNTIDYFVIANFLLLFNII